MKTVFSLKLKLLVLLISVLFVTSCYTVRIKTVQGVPMPDPVSDRTDYYRNMMVVEKDTVIRLGAVNKDFTLLIKDCEEDGLHTVEYRNTFGGVLLSGITFGRRRQVKLKYVCIKPSN